MDQKDLWESDRFLLRQIAEGDEKAFESLYRETARKTHFYLIRMLGEKDLAEEVLAETYTQVWKNAGSFRGESSAGTWIIGIARNLAKKALGKKGRMQHLDERFEAGDENPGVYERVDRSKLLIKAISNLSPEHREVLDLVFFCHMTYPEAARTIGIPVNTVKTRVFYAKGRLKSIFDDMGLTRDDL